VAKSSVRIDDRVIEIDLAAFTFDVNGPGDYVVSDGARRFRVVVAGPPEDRWIFVDGRVARAEIVSGGRTRRRARGGGHDMAAPMPATVVKILVAPGATVEKGEVLLMLEAMKMELAIRAARAGTVRAINCRPGELVQPGAPLVEIDG
jgi:3-methylcrotonyl-CoA carboxylase alpha subunit